MNGTRFIESYYLPDNYKYKMYDDAFNTVHMESFDAQKGSVSIACDWRGEVRRGNEGGGRDELNSLTYISNRGSKC